MDSSKQRNRSFSRDERYRWSECLPQYTLLCDKGQATAPKQETFVARRSIIIRDQLQPQIRSVPLNTGLRSPTERVGFQLRQSVFLEKRNTHTTW